MTKRAPRSVDRGARFLRAQSCFSGRSLRGAATEVAEPAQVLRVLDPAPELLDLAAQLADLVAQFLDERVHVLAVALRLRLRLAGIVDLTEERHPAGGRRELELRRLLVTGEREHVALHCAALL